MKQTAIEFLVNEFKQKLMGDNLPEWVEKIIQQAKEMEKAQIIESFKQGIAYWNDDEWKLIDIEQYYNETFKSE